MGVTRYKDVNVHLTGYGTQRVQISCRNTLVAMNKAYPNWRMGQGDAQWEGGILKTHLSIFSGYLRPNVML